MRRASLIWLHRLSDNCVRAYAKILKIYSSVKKCTITAYFLFDRRMCLLLKGLSAYLKPKVSSLSSHQVIVRHSSIFCIACRPILDWICTADIEIAHNINHKAYSWHKMKYICSPNRIGARDIVVPWEGVFHTSKTYTMSMKSLSRGAKKTNLLEMTKARPSGSAAFQQSLSNQHTCFAKIQRCLALTNRKTWSKRFTLLLDKDVKQLTPNLAI